MIWKPYEALAKELRFVEIPERRQVEAKIGDSVVMVAAYAAIATTEAHRFWKIEVDRALRRMSSTVVLRTACGCERRLDLPDSGCLHEFRVPLRGRVRFGGLHSFAEAAEADFGKIRSFRWEGRLLSDDGFRVLEERL